MKPDDLPGCSALPAMERCDAELPDNPQCAPNYHFGMLLGVEDFRAEQGFHLGRLRRHQRLLHGAGVVAGYAVSQPKDRPQELRVGPGLAVDALGRDLQLDTAQCVSLPLWWLAHRGDDAFHDVENPDDATFDLDVMACYSCCLGSPVPAIAEPCAGDAADVAYSRICETVKLSLVRAPDDDEDDEASPKPQPFHLLRMWLSMAPPRTDADGQPLPADQWLIERWNALKAMSPAEQSAERPKLMREVLARAVAEESVAAPEHEADESDLCLRIARLRGLHLKLDADGWQVDIAAIEMGVRDTLLPTSLLQALLLAEPAAQPPLAGPVVVRDGATLAGDAITLVFSQPLAAASVSATAFAVSEFVEGQGWKPFTLVAPTPTYDETDITKPSVRLKLDRTPTGQRVRITVIGSGNTPLLGASLLPAGALSPDSEGRNLSTTIPRG
ncbi:MAG: hypothetical protein AB1430_13165 [Pseudomonadota bacterium]